MKNWDWKSFLLLAEQKLGYQVGKDETYLVQQLESLLTCCSDASKGSQTFNCKNFLCPFSALNENRLSTVSWWLHFNRQQTLAVNSAALTKERSDVNHDHGSSNGVEAARAKIALVLAKWVSASAFEEGNGKVDLPGPRDMQQCKKLYALLQWET